jgi:hypothetical protein
VKQWNLPKPKTKNSKRKSNAISQDPKHGEANKDKAEKKQKASDDVSDMMDTRTDESVPGPKSEACPRRSLRIQSKQKAQKGMLMFHLLAAHFAS